MVDFSNTRLEFEAQEPLSTFQLLAPVGQSRGSGVMRLSAYLQRAIDRNAVAAISSRVHRQPLEQIRGGSRLAYELLHERLLSNSAASTRENDICQSGSTWRPYDFEQALDAGLYLVGTPIGNLEDITLRALRVLHQADIILAEDTRHSRKLLNHYNIDTAMTSFHEHNEHAKQEQVDLSLSDDLRTQKRTPLVTQTPQPQLSASSAQVLEMVRSGMKVAMISDAGMPLVSDPGASLVKAMSRQKLKVYPVPGPSAVIAAWVTSGFQNSSFMFCGFLPPKQSARSSVLAKLSGLTVTLIFFASPHALQRILNDMADSFSGDRQCAVAREVTKVHEEFFRGTLAEAAAEFSSREAKGELTIIVEGAAADRPVISDTDIEDGLLGLMADGCSPSTASKLLSKTFGASRNHVYELALKLKEGSKVKAGNPEKSS